MNHTLRPHATENLRQIGHGAAAGLAATVPMTIAMEVIQRLLPPDEQTPQEPLIITRKLLMRTGLDRYMDRHQQLALTAVAHFAYGAASGAAYLWLGQRLPLPQRLRGPAFGLLVWAGSYAGWLPVLKILPPPSRRPVGRNLLLIGAHLVWGVACASAARVETPR